MPLPSSPPQHNPIHMTMSGAFALDGGVYQGQSTNQPNEWNANTKVKQNYSSSSNIRMNLFFFL